MISKGNWYFHEIYLENTKSIELISEKYKFDIVIHLAAQAGVRYSLINPVSYINSNLDLLPNLITGLRK